MRRIPCRALALAAAACLAAAALAIAQDRAAGTQVTIGHDGTAFSGVVASSEGRCARARKVILWNSSSYGQNPIARDLSNNRRRWRIETGPIAGEYYVRAPRTVRRVGEDRLICRAARSKLLSIPAS